MTNEIDIDKINEIILEEIALEGLEGCTLKRFFNLLKPYEDSLNFNLNDEKHKNFILKLIIAQKNIDFFTIESNSRSSSPKTINSNNLRGFCSNFDSRTCASDEIRSIVSVNYKKIENDFGSSLVLVASQNYRENSICPCYKSLKYEQLNDVEYCVLEAIAKSRKNGINTSGDYSLAQKFKLAPKQLHYVLGILEKHDFIVKKNTTSAKNRCVVYLRKFEQKNETSLELVSSYLLREHASHECPTHQIKSDLSLSTKQLKNIMALGEKQGILERFSTQLPMNQLKDFKSDEEDSEMEDDEKPITKKQRLSKSKLRLVRMLRLTRQFIEANAIKIELDEDDDDEGGCNHDDLSLIGSEIDNISPLFAQIFKCIEKSGTEGVSLRKIGYIFGLDFYKSRRIGAHLQSHPEIVTIVKETERNRAKYQTIVFRKFLTEQQVKQEQTVKNQTGFTQTPFQALVSERAERRRQIILSYLETRKICTKVEIDREIRKIEEEEKQKGVLDAKTTKRMLQKIESEGILILFEIKVKNQTYLAVRLSSVSETSQEYISFMNGFSRTVNFGAKKSEPINVSVDKQPLEEDDGFHLSREYQKLIVSQLDFSFSFAKCYGLVSKFQKALILHRYLQYLLYFYDGIQCNMPDINDVDDNIPKIFTKKFDYESEKVILDSAKPSACYQTNISWKMFIPPINNKSDLPQNCCFIGDLMANIPISVYTSIVAVNFRIPGLLSILKHPYKRHMLFRDLPKQIIAALIHERRYLQKILGSLQLLAALGLVTFVEDESKKHQPTNRSLQSQLIYIHRQAAFLDTTKNQFESWSDIDSFNKKDYDRIEFSFDSFEWVLAYWQRLLHVSLNTYKFNVISGLKESKRLRAILQKETCKQIKLSQVIDLKPLVGDYLGPGGYDSQLFLNAIANWVLPTNIGKNAVQNLIDYLQTDSQVEYFYTELAMSLPLQLYRSLPKKATKRKVTNEREIKKVVKQTKHETERVEKVKNRRTLFKIRLAKQIIQKAKEILINKKFKPNKKIITKKQQAEFDQKRATWSKEEDDVIILIKIASLYLMPSEKSVQFKVIHDVMNEIMPSTIGKKTQSFGRRMKVLCKMNSVRLFISNQLEALKHNRGLQQTYSNIRLKRTTELSEQAKAFSQLIQDMIKLRKSNSNDSDLPNDFNLPKSKEELFKKYSIQNKSDVFNNEEIFSQPKNFNDISFYSLQSAVHSSILINDKTPRDFEASKLFEQYSDEMLTRVIHSMSNQHCIIAPTKCSEMRRKQVISVSKHIGKAYHISQRYQYKWLSNMSNSLIQDINVFSDHINKTNELDCTDRDSQGMTAYIAHNLDNTNLQAKIEVPNKIWVSKFL